MADPSSSGIPSGAQVDALKASIDAMLASAKPGQTVLRAFTDQMKKGAAETKQSTSEFNKLSQILPKLREGTKTYASAVEYATAKLVDDQKLLTEAGQRNHEDEMKFIKESISSIQAKGSADRDSAVKIAALHAKGRDLEKENMMARLENTVAVGKASGAFGPMVKGAVAQVQQYGVKAAGMAGDVMGSTGAAMASMAVAATLVVGVFMALKAVIEGVAGAARDASEGGLELTSGIETKYMERMRKATGTGPGNLVRVLNPEEVLGNLKNASNQFVYDVGVTGKGYDALLQGGKDFRNEQRLGAISFVADAMLVGKAYGIQGDEAVKMATRMGTLGRGPMKQVLGNFTLLAEESRRLGTPLDALMGTMEALSQATEGANLSTSQLTSMTLAYYDAMKKGDNTMVGFKDMRAEDIQKHVANLMKSINSIDPKRVMALNQTPGGTFQAALENMYKDKMGGIDKALDNAAQKMKLGKDYMTSKGSVMGDYKLAMAMGIQGNERELILAGAELRRAKSGRTLNPDTVKTIGARMMDSRFDQAKSVGQNIAQGADVMQVIAGTLSNILKVMVETVNRVFTLPFFSSAGGSHTARELEQASRAQQYGHSAGGGRSVSYGRG